MLVDREPTTPNDNWEYGSITFKCPLVIFFNKTNLMQYDNNSWKNVLFEFYNRKGKALSKALRLDGFDGIVTIGAFETKEIVDLTGIEL